MNEEFERFKSEMIDSLQQRVKELESKLEEKDIEIRILKSTINKFYYL
jgi:peptidoglycan hydrolase CwlO-like protein